MTPRKLLVATSISLLLALAIAQSALAVPVPAQASATFTVTLSFSPSNLPVNSQTTGSYSISSPNPPYTISMTGAPPGCGPPTNPFTTSNASGTWTCRPTATGNFNVQVNVQDNAGNSGFAQTTITVNSNTGGGGSGSNNTGGIDLSFLQNLLPVVMITGILFLGSTVAIAVSAVALAILVPRRLKQIRNVLEGQPIKKIKAAETRVEKPKDQPPGDEL